MKILVIPDIHLKPWILEKAEQYTNEVNHIIMLGDYFDDFNKGIQDYVDMMDALRKFVKNHKNLTMLWGNHDYAYYAHQLCTGHFPALETQCYDWICELDKEVELKTICRFDDVLFCHGGLSVGWFYKMVREHGAENNIDSVINKTNELTLHREPCIWNDNSPIWQRPQCWHNKMYDMYQVVGHTPVEEVYEKNNILSTDVFSTYQDGTPIGSQKFVIFDTISHKFETK